MTAATEAVHDFATAVRERPAALEAFAADGGLDASVDPVEGAVRAGGVAYAFCTGHSEAFAMAIAGRAGGLTPSKKISLRDRSLISGMPVADLKGGRVERDPAAADDPGARAARRFAGRHRIDVDADAPGPVPVVAGRALVIGRDVHRHPRARAVDDGVRAAGGPVLVVDLGWPSADRADVDVATSGASRAVGAALLLLLDRMED